MNTLRINSETWITRTDGSTALIASVCNHCGKIDFPPLDRCPSCWNTELEKKEIVGPGTLYSFTVVHQRRKGLPLPYVVGYVDFQEGIRAFGIIDVHPSRVTIDLKVKPGLLHLSDDDGNVFGEMYCFQTVDGEGN